jgi:hypothetical protein
MSQLPDGMTGTQTHRITVLAYAVVLTSLPLTPHPLWFVGKS